MTEEPARTRLAGADVVLPTGIAAVDVVIDHGRVVDVIARESPSSADRVVDLRGLVLSPGFIDLQTNGGFGVDLLNQPERVDELARALPATGVTAFLPTLISAPFEQTQRVATKLSGATLSPSSAQVLGIHAEGPMLQPARAGVHNLRHLQTPAAISDRVMGLPGLRMVTLAPELEGAIDLTERLSARGILVAAGHTAASNEDLDRGAAAGVRYVTHLFNAMSPMHHRQPGAVIAALLDDRLSCGLIIDGHHLHPDTVRLAWRLLGPARCSLVTDATALAGMPEGATAHLGDRTIRLIDSAAQSVDDTSSTEATLAGSALTIDRAVRALRHHTGCSIPDALATVTSVPARLLGETDRGVIAEAARADLVVLDQKLNVVETIVGGAPVLGAFGNATESN